MKEVIKYMKDNKLNPLKLEENWCFSESDKKIFNLIAEKFTKDGSEFICEEGVGLIEVTNRDSKIIAVKLSLLVNYL